MERQNELGKGLMHDLVGSAIALVVVWGMFSFFFEYRDPVLSEDASEQLVALNGQ